MSTYLELKEAGFSDQEIREHKRPQLQAAGFSDQEINAYFKGYDPVSMLDAIQYGFQGSVTGLASREKLPDSLTPVQVSQMSTMQRVGMQVGTLAGDVPTLAAGAAAGLLGGPAAPVSVPASAMALTEGTRAYYMEQIKNGDVRSSEEFLRRSGAVLGSAAKGAVIGGLTGGAGVVAGRGAAMLGATAGMQTAASLAAETATMPTAAAGIEGRLPEPHEFVDAAILVGGLHAAGGLRHVPEMVPKLRDIYAKTGKDPIAVAQAAEADPTVRQDILSINRDVPQAIAEEIAAKRPQDIKPESEAESSAPTTPTAASDEGALQSAGSGTHIPIAEDKPVMPEGELSRAAAVPLSDVVQSLAEALEVPIRTGKMGPSGRNPEGIYKVTPEVIRTRTANDVATVVHEAGHHIQKQLFGDISAAPLRAYRDELAPIATQPRAGQSALPEGFAEFVAKYVVNPDEAKAVAPRFYEHFEKTLSDRAPEFGTALLNAREAVKRWAEQPAAQEVLSHISIEGRESEGLISRLLSKDTWDSLYTNFVDRLYPLKKATDILAEGKELPADMNPYTLARTFAGAKGKATHFIERSPFTYGTWDNVGKPLAETLRAVDNLDEFRAFLVSRRGLELESRGIKSGIRPEAMRATAERLGEKYEPLGRELDEYQNHVVNYLVDSGMLSAETAAAMREMNQNYVPFFRVMENAGGFLGSGKSLTGRNPIRRIKGSGRDIIDPLESIIKNTYAMIEAAEKNGIGRALTDLASKTDGAGWLVEKLPTPKTAVRVKAEDVSKAFIDALGPISPGVKDSIKALAESADMGEMLTFWQNAATLDKKSQIAVFRDGKREVYQVAPEIAEVMNGLSTDNIPLLVKLISIPAKMLRAGATLTPDFMVRNLIRDAVSTGVLSRTGFIPGLDTAKGLKRAVTKDKSYWDWVKAGGDQASLVSMDRTTLQTTLKDIAATGYTERVWNVVKNPLELLRLGSELSEKMTRLGEFSKATEKHGNDKAGLMQAAYESRDIMDFSRRGKLTASFNLITAFFNASMQGLDRTARGAVENPRRFLVRTALFIGIPSILNAINNCGDKDIAEVPRAQRDMFWITPIGQGENKVLLRIPKPFEQGVMFGSTLERATEFILDAAHDKYGSVEKARQEAFRGLGASMLDVSAPNLVPTAFAPVIEAFANRSLPFDRPIIPKNREGLLPEYQYTPSTTELTKALSSFVGALPPVGDMNTFSPARAENYIRGWTGGMGMYALQLVDAMARKAGVVDDPVNPAATLADIPFVRAFVIRHPSMGAESIQRFFDHYEESTSYLKTINALGKDFKYNDVANLLPYSVYQAMDAPHKALSEITKAIDLINKIPSMTPDEKRQQIDSLYFHAIEVAKFGNKVFEALQPDIERLKQRAEGK
ncbi:Large polyvalent protein associated domain 38 [anaerobic digester metagenome]